jgi:hypothetical protein
LKVVSGGTLDGITITQVANAVDLLATLPQVLVATGDLIVVHLNPVGAAGAAPASETTAKNQYPAAVYGANYDGAWDVRDVNALTLGVAYTLRVLEVRDPQQNVQDAVPFYITSTSEPPGFQTEIQALQAAGQWLPADCAGAPCTFATTPSLLDISVAWDGAGTTPSGNSIGRKTGSPDTNQASDWNAAGAQSLGLANP